MKINNYSGSILAKLNDTMQTKQHALKKKTALTFNKKQDFLGAIFANWKILSRKCTKSSVFIIHFNKLELYSIYLDILRCCFLMHKNIWKRIQKYFQAILLLLRHNFWKRWTLNINSDITILFLSKIRIFWSISRNLHQWPQFFYFIFQIADNIYLISTMFMKSLIPDILMPKCGISLV